MRSLRAAIPVVAGALFFAWAMAATLRGIPGCDGVPYQDAVDPWAALGVLMALFVGATGAGILAFRLSGWLALAVTVLTVLAVALGAQAGYAVGMQRSGCEWDEGPALTLFLFTAPAALFGFAIGWALRRAKV